MNAEQFVYWLRGFTELTSDAQPTPEQWKSITEHLQSVFVKTTAPVLKPGTIRTSEFRHEDALRLIGIQQPNWPFDLSKTTITC